MGRQINFHLGPGDQAGFEVALRKAGDVVFLRDWPVEAVAQEVSNTTREDQDHLRLIVTRRDWLSELTYLPIQAQKKWTLDTLRDPIVEFDRCFCTERLIRPGRLYRVDRYWDNNDQLFYKPQEFARWAENLFRHAREFLLKTESFYYAGPQAAKMRSDGILLGGLDIAR